MRHQIDLLEVLWYHNFVYLFVISSARSKPNVLFPSLWLLFFNQRSSLWIHSALAPEFVFVFVGVIVKKFEISPKFCLFGWYICVFSGLYHSYCSGLCWFGRIYSDAWYSFLTNLIAFCGLGNIQLSNYALISKTTI